MPMNRYNQRGFTRNLMPELRTVTVWIRGDDQRQGVITTYKLFRCRRSQINKTGENIQEDISVGYTTIWHVPRSELDRIGLSHVNSLTTIIEYDPVSRQTRYWQPEATTSIDYKLFGLEIDLSCVRIDPPPTTT